MRKLLLVAILVSSPAQAQIYNAYTGSSTVTANDNSDIQRQENQRQAQYEQNRQSQQELSQQNASENRYNAGVHYYGNNGYQQ